MMNEKELLDELRELTRNRDTWKDNINHVAEYLKDDSSVNVKAKSLWLLGEMGLRHPEKIKNHIDDIAGYLSDDHPKLRERSANAIGRIGRADENLALPHLDKLMGLRHDTDENVRHAFIWACENIATNNPEIFSNRLEIFFEMMGDPADKVRIEAPEMFRVIGKTRPECIRPYLEKLESISKNDKNRIVRIHCAGAVRITKKHLEY